jgi:hypothetical protein
LIAQQRTIRVVSDDGQPVAYANVTLTGERPRITNEKGEVELGAAAHGTVTVDVRRLGFEPWYGDLAFGDTVTTGRVTLRRTARRMFTVTITDSSGGVPAFLRGFYERMLARQHGVGSGIYMTPEEVDKRAVNMSTALLQGMNGISLRHTSSGKIVAMNSEGTCQMTVLVDGRRVCPVGGCNIGGASGSSGGVATSAAPGTGARRSRNPSVSQPNDDQYVLLDALLTPNEVAAIEVYPRGATIPPSLPTVDASCGLIAFWTGGRKAPQYARPPETRSVVHDRQRFTPPFVVAAAKIDHVAHAVAEQHARRNRRTSSALTLHDDGKSARNFREAVRQVADRNVQRARQMPVRPLRRISHVDYGHFAAGHARGDRRR